MKKYIYLFGLSCLLVLAACSSDSTEDTTSIDETTDTSETDNTIGEENNNDPDPVVVPSAKPNILLIIADDMGLDATPGYEVGTLKPNMPNLSRLMNAGIKYTNVWSAPVCTPTRGGMITGKYGFRTGITKVDAPLNLTETTLQKLVRDGSEYETAVVGKWHLSRDANHPNDVGVGYYAGSLRGAVTDYSNWELTTNGVETTVSEYITSKYTDLARDWIASQDKSKPWFLWLAHNAPHDPFHLPPTELHDRDNLPSDQASIDANPQPYYFAMIESMDHEIGRLLDSMDEATRNNTLVIFVGDNGTPGGVAQEYGRRTAKGSVYQGGINVPMVISGAGVTRGGITDESLIETVDIFATVAELTGAGNANIHDSNSFASTFIGDNTNTQEYVFSEVETDGGAFDRAIRNATHKYMLLDDGTERLHKLPSDQLEELNWLNTNRLPLSEEDQTAYNALKTKLTSIISD